MARIGYERVHTAERLAAMVNYGLLIAAPFTLNSLGILAMFIAYLRRGSADPVARSHFDFQIRRYWTDLLLVVLGFLCAAGALAAGFGAGIGGGLAAFGVDVPRGDLMHAGLVGMVLLVMWGVLWAMGLLGLLFGSIFGALRLASGRPAGRTRRR